MKFHPEEVAERGETLFEKKVPTHLAAKTPLIVALSTRLMTLGLLEEARQERIEVCFEEALNNAMVHGNRQDPESLVYARIYRCDGEWGVQITDEGEGFSAEDVPDPDDPEFPWLEKGRGIHLMKLIADRVDFYSGGRTVVLSWDAEDVVAESDSSSEIVTHED